MLRLFKHSLQNISHGSLVVKSWTSPLKLLLCCEINLVSSSAFLSVSEGHTTNDSKSTSINCGLKSNIKIANYKSILKFELMIIVTLKHVHR